VYFIAPCHDDTSKSYLKSSRNKPGVYVTYILTPTLNWEENYDATKTK